MYMYINTRSSLFVLMAVNLSVCIYAHVFTYVQKSNNKNFQGPVRYMQTAEGTYGTCSVNKRRLNSHKTC